MSKSKQNKNFLNHKAINRLLSQQNSIKDKYEKINIENNKELMSIKKPDDYYPGNFDNIKHNLKELPQYSSLYLKRLELTKKKLIEESKNKWPKIHICPNILDLKGKVSNNIYLIINYYYLGRINNNWIDL